MKYNFEWFIVGLVTFWILEVITIFAFPCKYPHQFLESSIPLAFWGVASMLEYGVENKK